MVKLEENLLSLLGQVQVNMPWKVVGSYIETILHYGMNVEIGFEASELDRVPAAEFQSVAERLQSQGCRITLHGPFWDLGPGSVDPLIRQISRFRLGQFFDVLQIFRPVQVVCHTGYDPSHHKGHRQFWLDQSVAAWEPLARRAESLSIPVLLENVWEHDPDFHRDLLERIHSPFLGFCLDVGHQHSFSRTPLREWLEALADFLMEIHLHDNDGSADAHLPVGQGSIDFDLLFGFLRERAIAPVLTLEPHREEHLAQSLAGLSQVLGGA